VILAVAMAAPTISEPKAPGGEDAPAGFHLLVLGPEHTATHQLPERGVVTIGREEDAEVRIVDPRASRYHARLHVGEHLEVEDLGSSNGTSLRDQPLPPQERVQLAPGDAITIGSTLLVVQRRQPSVKPRRLWPHGYFEVRLIEECARAEGAKGTFALARLHLEPGTDARRCEDLLAAAIRPGDVLAGYGPNEYELLLVDTGKAQAQAAVDQLAGLLRRDKLAARAGVAFFPADGNSPQALVSVACDRVRGERSRPPLDGAIVLQNPVMRELYATAEKVAKGTINVLIVGETGAGKEILAQTVHRLSPRADGPFVCFNCAALADSLLESELFGHEKGAFTGAAQAKTGLLEAASGGTFFMDEVGEMSPNLQAKLLRAIETRTVLPVGSTKPRAVDVRFIAATNRDLDEEVAAKRFREDLYFRLGAVTLALPPLHERTDELEPLARRFLEDVAQQIGRPVPTLSAEALELMRAYAWPGNIRELRNVMERALLLCSGSEITAADLPVERMRKGLVRPVPGAPPARTESETIAAGRASMGDIERQAILDALARCNGNQTRAAELLGMPRRTFCAKLKEHGIPRPRC
jgi:two-component system response regulator AtoC